LASYAYPKVTFQHKKLQIRKNKIKCTDASAFGPQKIRSRKVCTQTYRRSGYLLGSPPEFPKVPLTVGTAACVAILVPTISTFIGFPSN